MKTIDFSPISCGEGYETPSVQLNDIQPEGLLCQSGQFEEWKEETLEW